MKVIAMVVIFKTNPNHEEDATVSSVVLNLNQSTRSFPSYCMNTVTDSRIISNSSNSTHERNNDMKHLLLLL